MNLLVATRLHVKVALELCLTLLFYRVFGDGFMSLVWRAGNTPGFLKVLDLLV